MEKRMERSLIYNGTITAEQLLFYEIRIASKYYLDGTSVEDAIEEIKKNNLFQYPTKRLVARMVRSCYKRLDALDNEQLWQELSSAPPEIAKQINLYVMIRYNRIVWDFMVGVIGEKFRSQDFEFSWKDLNVFFSHLQEQNDDIAGWSESTVNKIKQVLTKVLVETQILDTFKSWMFLSSFEKLRGFVLAGYDFESLVDFGTELFEGKVGHNPIVAWVNRKSHTAHAMTGIRLVDYCFSRRDEKKTEFFNKRNYHYPKQFNFSKIPGSHVAYWASERIMKLFDHPDIATQANTCIGMRKGNNELFFTAVA